MDYPKPVMKKTELQKIGFAEAWLLMVYRTTRGIAWKSGPSPNSTILFDTAELERYRRRASVGR